MTDSGAAGDTTARSVEIIPNGRWCYGPHTAGPQREAQSGRICGGPGAGSPVHLLRSWPSARSPRRPGDPGPDAGGPGAGQRGVPGAARPRRWADGGPGPPIAGAAQERDRTPGRCSSARNWCRGRARARPSRCRPAARTSRSATSAGSGGPVPRARARPRLSAGPAVPGQVCRPVTVSAAAAKAGSPVAACPRRQASTSLTWCGSRLRTAAPVSSLPGGLAG